MKFELTPHHRNLSDEELLDDLKRIAGIIKRDSFSTREYDALGGKFRSGTISARFGGWNKALGKAGLINSMQQNISEEELFDDLKRVAGILKRDSFSTREYDTLGGKFRSGTISLRFGGWNKALEKAGLIKSMQQNISEEELFENMERVWIELGKQPVHRDMKAPLSKYSSSPYVDRFGSWIKALEAFIGYMNTPENENLEYRIKEPPVESPSEEPNPIKHKTKREPSARLKVMVLMRDGNKCKLCGITVTGENIHFDHIKPWSKGGETLLENLQVLCAEHNLAKGDWQCPTE